MDQLLILSHAQRFPCSPSQTKLFSDNDDTSSHIRPWPQRTWRPSNRMDVRLDVPPSVFVMQYMC